jgi:tetratricopeptide (TPR) repeat protein
MGLPHAARKEYESARDLQKMLVDAFPAMPHYQQELARSRSNLGSQLREMDLPDAARKEYESARDLRKKLADTFPDVPQYQAELARTHNNLGELLRRQGQKEAARREFGTARDLLQKLVTTFPAQPDYKVDLGISLRDFGVLVRDDGQPAESLHWFDLAILKLTPVYESDRRVVRPKNALRNSHANRARAYDELKKHTEAVKDWNWAIELSPGPEQPIYRTSRARSRMLAGEAAEAIAEVKELTEMTKPTDRHWYNFACVYAIGSRMVSDKKQEYAKRAMELLRESVKAGYMNAANMKQDPDLESLRGREDFIALLAELETPSKQKKDEKP